MSEQIAPCPMPGCGGYCEPLRCGPPPGLGWYVKCFNCGHNSGQRHSVDNAIIDHNALCADVTLARNLRKLKGTTFIVKYSGGEVVVCNDPSNTGLYGHLNRTEGSLDAALAQLAAKIGGDDGS